MENNVLATEKLVLKCQSASNVNTRLKEAIDDLTEITKTLVPNEHIDKEHKIKTQRTINTYRNSTIKLFELSLDTNWKYLKEFLWAIHGLNHASPKDVMRACLQLGLLTKDETVMALTMIDDRNKAAHSYKESFCDYLCKVIPMYHNLLEKLIKQSGLC